MVFFGGGGLETSKEKFKNLNEFTSSKSPIDRFAVFMLLSRVKYLSNYRTSLKSFWRRYLGFRLDGIEGRESGRRGIRGWG